MAVIVDFPGTGELLNFQGNIPILTDQEALKNAINLWICSFRGERLYQPNLGGVITNNLMKPVSDDRALKIRNDIINGLTYYFNPRVDVSECVVVPDYEKSTYWVKVSGYCPALQIPVDNHIGIKSLV